jgi:hypothetical protein
MMPALAVLKYSSFPPLEKIGSNRIFPNRIFPSPDYLPLRKQFVLLFDKSP